MGTHLRVVRPPASKTGEAGLSSPAAPSRPVGRAVTGGDDSRTAASGDGVKIDAPPPHSALGRMVGRLEFRVPPYHSPGSPVSTDLHVARAGALLAEARLSLGRAQAVRDAFADIAPDVMRDLIARTGFKLEP